MNREGKTTVNGNPRRLMSADPSTAHAPPLAESAAARFREVRARSTALAAPLSPEDACVQ